MNTIQLPPVLFIVFNRPEITFKSLEILRKNKIPKLYISQDGPREESDTDKENCERVKMLIETIDWPCEIITQIHKKNLGCKEGVISAINWFFENVEEGIILEDDIMPGDGFFQFCSQNLDLYREDHQVLAIQGFNQFGQKVESGDYFFARGFYPWGWATWKSRWLKYNKNISAQDIPYVSDHFNYKMLKAIKLNLRLIEKNILDTWDIQFVAMQIKYNGFIVTPYANLTTNIGVDGAHSVGNSKILSFSLGIYNYDFNRVKKNIQDDERINKLLWQEYKDGSWIIDLKYILLNIGIYYPIKKIVKILKIR